jgi:hypothetical protein
VRKGRRDARRMRSRDGAAGGCLEVGVFSCKKRAARVQRCLSSVGVCNFGSRQFGPTCQLAAGQDDSAARAAVVEAEAIAGLLGDEHLLAAAHY